MIDKLIAPYGDMLTKLIDIGIDKWKESQQFKTVVAVARESLLREIKLNIALIDEIEKCKDEDSNLIQMVVKHLSTDAFENLVVAGIPLGKMFNEELTPEFWGRFDLNERDSNNVANLKDVSELIDRTYHRLIVYKIRVELGVDRTRFDYFKKLLRASEAALSLSDATGKK